MYLLYFLLWVIFNGQFTLEIALFGIVVAAALFAFTCKFTDYSVAKEKKLLRHIISLIHYVGVLVVEIVKANFAVIHFILTEKEEAEPALVLFQTDLKTPMGRAALADAITLTPGTITVLLEDNRYSVHCLDNTFAEGIDKSVFVDMLQEYEKKVEMIPDEKEGA
ncbi:MAG: Na+/H+ antiporter subunit E [Blautia sp.]|nr:Na+/H+ antiporter subunit E [Lachnoclostridium sp.]MCM1211965.1 Na+/H+ antiporter subunit E [Blautia sp.]